MKYVTKPQSLAVVVGVRVGKMGCVHLSHTYIHHNCQALNRHRQGMIIFRFCVIISEVMKESILYSLFEAIYRSYRTYTTRRVTIERYLLAAG
jgi:hypothetical protein